MSIYRIKNIETIRDFFNGNTSITKLYKDEMCGICFSNDGTEDCLIQFNSLPEVIIIVKTNEVFDEHIPNFNSITITTTTEFRCYVRGAQ